MLPSQACLWHLDMETFKMICFAKLSVQVLTLEHPMDILSAVGVLRSEQGYTPFKPASQEEPSSSCTGSYCSVVV